MTMDLTDIYTTFHPANTEYILFSAHGTFYKVGHILDHKVSLIKYKKTLKCPLCTLSDHNGMKTEFNSKRNYRNYVNTGRSNNIFLNDQ